MCSDDKRDFKILFERGNVEVGCGRKVSEEGAGKGFLDVVERKLLLNSYEN